MPADRRHRASGHRRIRVGDSKRLAREEGVFTEPAGAVALAGALRAAANSDVDKDAMIVCLVTGSGFKDEGALDRINAEIECPMLDADAIDAW